MINIIDIYVDDIPNADCDVDLGYIIITQDDKGRFDFIRGSTCACGKGCGYKDCLRYLHVGQEFKSRRELWNMIGEQNA